MAMLVWAMMGLAIWHFTIFLPDRFWGGIVGAFLGALFGAILFGLDRQRLQRPRPGRHHARLCARGGPRRARRDRARLLRRRAPGQRGALLAAAPAPSCAAARARTRARCGSRAARRATAERSSRSPARLSAICRAPVRVLRAQVVGAGGDRDPAGRRSPRPPPRARARARRSLPGGAHGGTRSGAGRIAALKGSSGVISRCIGRSAHPSLSGRNPMPPFLPAIAPTLPQFLERSNCPERPDIGAS